MQVKSKSGVLLPCVLLRACVAPGDIKRIPLIEPMSIEYAERVTMQATPQDNPGGNPNDRDTAETSVHPGQEHDRDIVTCCMCRVGEP